MYYFNLTNWNRLPCVWGWITGWHGSPFIWQYEAHSVRAGDCFGIGQRACESSGESNKGLCGDRGSAAVTCISGSEHEGSTTEGYGSLSQGQVLGWGTYMCSRWEVCLCWLSLMRRHASGRLCVCSCSHELIFRHGEGAAYSRGSGRNTLRRF